MNNEKALYYNLSTGEVSEVDIDKLLDLDDFQIPISKKPKPSCKNCHGRGYIGYDNIKKYYPMCRCILKHIDRERIGDNKRKY